jgi:hypothetical protein
MWRPSAYNGQKHVPGDRIPRGLTAEGPLQKQRYMGVEAMGDLLNPPPANETLQLPPKAA